MRTTTKFVLLIVFAISALAVVHQGTLHAQDPQPIFRTSVALVPITAVVRDSRNRVVLNLTREDFEILENGSPRPIVQFRAFGDAPLSVALLFDASGSMRLAANLEKAKRFVGHFLNQLNATSDETALFTFDSAVHEDVPFTKDRDRIRSALERADPWGQTSLYDAVAETAKGLAKDSSTRRVLVVITDGLDTSSRLTLSEVSGIASAIDVPVYVVTMVSPVDVADREEDGLANLAYWTGGDLLYVSAPEDPAIAATELLAALRHQYFLAIESSTSVGWHRLDLRARRPGLTVRARTGYLTTHARGE